MRNIQNNDIFLAYMYVGMRDRMQPDLKSFELLFAEFV